jgi:hypothetical protein
LRSGEGGVERGEVGVQERDWHWAVLTTCRWIQCPLSLFLVDLAETYMVVPTEMVFQGDNILRMA